MTLSDCYKRVKEYNSGRFVHYNNKTKILTWSVQDDSILVKDCRNDIIKIKLRKTIVEGLYGC